MGMGTSLVDQMAMALVETIINSSNLTETESMDLEIRCMDQMETTMLETPMHTMIVMQTPTTETLTYLQVLTGTEMSVAETLLSDLTEMLTTAILIRS